MDKEPRDNILTGDRIPKEENEKKEDIQKDKKPALPRCPDHYCFEDGM